MRIIEFDRKSYYHSKEGRNMYGQAVHGLADHVSHSSKSLMYKKDLFTRCIDIRLRRVMEK